MEKIENLDYNLKIYQNSNLYTFTSDSILLAKFVKIKKNEIVIDLGTGSGIIALYLAKKFEAEKIYGIEIQSELSELAKKSVLLNNLNEKIEIINKDMLDVNLRADVIVSNPPYKKYNSVQNANMSRAIARQELKIDLDKLLKTVNKLLKPNGRFYICYDSERSAELIYKLKSYKLEPKTMFFTYANLNKKASIVFIESVKGGKEEVKVLPPLITNDNNGKYIENLEIKDVR